LHARQSSGSWLVRIEDVDPPREVAGAADEILRVLDAFELHWDGSVVYQSRRRDIYETAAARLLSDGRAFRCSCTRSELRSEQEATSGRYPGTCRTRTRHERATSIRVRVQERAVETFVDGVQGQTRIELGASVGDYVVWRRDGLPAYHLAVCVDDAAQGVTTVVRGVDLLDSTGAHLHLQRALGLQAPAYFHVPVVVGADGQKLSKQTGAAPIAPTDSSRAAARVLDLLGASPPAELAGAPPRELWAWGAANWRIGALRGRRQLPAQR
jgi:glutamyl-Q tRNA(Asp) synthetase